MSNDDYANLIWSVIMNLFLHVYDFIVVDTLLVDTRNDDEFGPCGKIGFTIKLYKKRNIQLILLLKKSSS